MHLHLAYSFARPSTSVCIYMCVFVCVFVCVCVCANVCVHLGHWGEGLRYDFSSPKRLLVVFFKNIIRLNPESKNV